METNLGEDQRHKKHKKLRKNIQKKRKLKKESSDKRKQKKRKMIENAKTLKKIQLHLEQIQKMKEKGTKMIIEDVTQKKAKKDIFWEHHINFKKVFFDEKLHSLFEEYRLKFDKQTKDLVDIFDFIDKGMEVNTNELENAEAKALLLKIFESTDIKATQPGFFQLPRAIKKYKLRFFRLMRHMYKERYQEVLEYLESQYPDTSTLDSVEKLVNEDRREVEQTKAENSGIKNPILGDGEWEMG